MKTIKKIALFILIPLIFVGTTGISVFTHLCSKDGVSKQFFTSIEENCKQESEEISSCCSHQQSNSCDIPIKLNKEECCKEFISFYKISAEDSFKDLKLKFEKKALSYYVFFVEIYPYEAQQNVLIANSSSPPFVESSQFKCIKHCVFRI